MSTNTVLYINGYLDRTEIAVQFFESVERATRREMHDDTSYVT